jgi:hypothetical protein
VEAASAFLEPLGAQDRRTPYTTTRIAILKDGSTMPVLTMLARCKFGGIPKHVFPFWADGDHTNETLENVELAPRRRRLAHR